MSPNWSHNGSFRRSLPGARPSPSGGWNVSIPSSTPSRRPWSPAGSPGKSDARAPNLAETKKENIVNRGMLSCIAAALLLAAASPALAAAPPMADEVMAINRGWAHIAYEMNGSSTQTKALDKLAAQAAALVQRYPGKAEPLLWEGIVVSEQANRANIFHKLGLAKRARDILARAYAIDPKVADGGAAMSLGVLYYKVPGSTIGFGDDAKAKQLLQQALAIAPNGLDANYFYGDYLLDQGDKAGARAYLQKALRAPHDLNRPVWDAGRRREVQALLKKAA